MQKTVKIALIAGCFCMIVGLAIVGITWLTGVFGDESKDGGFLQAISSATYEDKTFTVKGAFDGIDVELASEDFKIFESNDGCRVEAHILSNKKMTVEIVNEELVIKCSNENFKMFNIDTEETYVHLYIDKTYFDGGIRVDTASGDVYLPGEFVFKTEVINTASGDVYTESQVEKGISIDAASGNVNISGVRAADVFADTASGDIKIERSAIEGSVVLKSASGDHFVNDLNAEKLESNTSSGDTSVTGSSLSEEIRIDTTSGETKFTKTTSKRFVANCTSGDITFDNFDAHEFYIDTSSGNVEGTLASGKKFLVDTSSGDIRVPSDEGNDICEINTTSGDVDLRIA